LGQFEGAGMEEESEGVVDGSEGSAIGELQEFLRGTERLFKLAKLGAGSEGGFAALEGVVGGGEAKTGGRRSGDEADDFGDGVLAEPLAEGGPLPGGELVEEGAGEAALFVEARTEAVRGVTEGERVIRAGVKDGGRDRGSRGNLCRLKGVHDDLFMIDD